MGTPLRLIAQSLMRAAQGGGAAALAARAAGLDVTYKTPVDTSTSADVASEIRFAELFHRDHPNIPVFGEESLGDEALAGPVPETGVILDSLDGTRNFQSGQAGWGVEAAYFYERRPIASAICQPEANLMMVADVENGVFVGPADGSSELLPVRFQPDYAPERIFICHELHRLSRGVDVRNGLLRFVERGLIWGNVSSGTAADGTMCLLRGKIDLYLNSYGGKIWDFAAGACAVAVAGGKVLAADGKPLRFDTWQMGVLFCASQAIAELAAEVLANPEPAS